MTRPAIGDMWYIEHVTPDVAGLRAVAEASLGASFSEPVPELGGAVSATLANGATWSIRAPMMPDVATATRCYLRVQDVDAAVEAAVAAGAQLMLEATTMPGDLGRIAIWSAGGLKHGVWQPGH